MSRPFTEAAAFARNWMAAGQSRSVTCLSPKSPHADDCHVILEFVATTLCLQLRFARYILVCKVMGGGGGGAGRSQNWRVCSLDVESIQDFSCHWLINLTHMTLISTCRRLWQSRGPRFSDSGNVPPSVKHNKKNYNNNYSSSYVRREIFVPLMLHVAGRPCLCQAVTRFRMG